LAQEHGPLRLRAALSLSDDLHFVRSSVVPLLERLASPALRRGTCRQPLALLLGAMYSVPGLMACLRTALEKEVVADAAGAAAVGWFVLSVASYVEGARDDGEVGGMVEVLEAAGGGAAAAAEQLKVLRAGGEGAGREEPSLWSRMLGLEDLKMRAGGRHDNDKTNFRDIQIMVTSEEVSSALRGRGCVVQSCCCTVTPRCRSSTWAAPEQHLIST
jgi:hypothetical protein